MKISVVFLCTCTFRYCFIWTAYEDAIYLLHVLTSIVEGCRIFKEVPFLFNMCWNSTRYHLKIFYAAKWRLLLTIWFEIWGVTIQQVFYYPTMQCTVLLVNIFILLINGILFDIQCITGTKTLIEIFKILKQMQSWYFAWSV